MDYMHLYKEFNKVFSILAHPDNIVRQELLIKNEYYIWNNYASVILLRFIGHHSEYAIQAKIIIYKGLMQSENDIPQILGTSGGKFYKLTNT